MSAKERITSLDDYKGRKTARRAFREWNRLFGSLQRIDENTRWADLPDKALLSLCEETPESRFAIYDLLTRASGLGSGYEFESLPPSTLWHLLDCYLVTMDRIRFECMRRLGWVEESVRGRENSIIDQVLRDLKTSGDSLLKPPRMTPRHPGFQQVSGENDFDYGRFLRMYAPDAVKAFRQRLIAHVDWGHKAEVERLD